MHTVVGTRAFSHLKKSAVFITEMRTDSVKVLIPEVTGDNDPYQNSRALGMLCNMKLPAALHPQAFFICIGTVQR